MTDAVTAALTTTLRGWAAIHYAEAIGTMVRIAHGDPVIGMVSCAATHGERPYRGSGPTVIDWPAIHAACIVVDAERCYQGRGALGFDGVVDAFGGSYDPQAYERRGLAGAVALLQAAQTIRQAAWHAIHGAHRMSGALGRDTAVAALRTALALDHLLRAIDAIGLYRYEPASQICGVTGYEDDDTVQVTGLSWLAGQPYETERPTMRVVRALIAGDVSPQHVAAQ